MNTLLVVPWDDERGGVVSVVENLARHLQTAGHGVLLFHSGSTILKDTITKLGFPGVQLRLTVPYGQGLRRIIRTIVFPFVFVSSLIQLLWFLRSQRIEIVNLHYPIDHFLYFAVCRHILPIRIVTSVHGRDAFLRERPLASYSWAFRLVIRSSDLIVLPSNAYRTKFLQAFPEARDRTIFIHNSVDPAQFKPVTAPQDAKSMNRYLLCIAVLRDDKAVDVLLQAAKPLLDGDRGLRLVLAGDGPLREELEALASSLGIKDQTDFLGYRGASEVAALLHGCELMVLPSRMEPFGIVLLEAMACKRPVVASCVGGIPEIVENEVSGILVEPENVQALTAALQRVLGDPDLRRTLAHNGYARVMERFCLSHNGQAYLKAFASLLRSEPPALHGPLGSAAD